MVYLVNLKTPTISDSQLQRMVIRDTSDSALDRFTAGEAGFTGKLPPSSPLQSVSTPGIGYSSGVRFDATPANR